MATKFDEFLDHLNPMNPWTGEKIKLTSVCCENGKGLSNPDLFTGKETREHLPIKPHQVLKLDDLIDQQLIHAPTFQRLRSKALEK